MTAVRVSLRSRLRLLAGKVRRCYLGFFRSGYIRASLARRHGECARCGACCRLSFRCPVLCTDALETACRFHTRRPPNCRLFPIDERDLADRALVAPDRPCGFTFDGDGGDEARGTRGGEGRRGRWPQENSR